jgi:hypothetical protein
MQNASLSNIHIWIMIMMNLCSKIPNSHFNCPLRVTQQWANAYSFKGNMSKQMNTLLNKVDAVSMALIIKLLKFLCELAKQFMSTFEIG